MLQARCHCLCLVEDAVPVDTHRTVSNKLKCYILSTRGNNNLFEMVFWDLHSVECCSISQDRVATVFRVTEL